MAMRPASVSEPCRSHSGEALPRLRVGIDKFDMALPEETDTPDFARRLREGSEGRERGGAERDDESVARDHSISLADARRIIRQG